MLGFAVALPLLAACGIDGRSEPNAVAPSEHANLLGAARDVSTSKHDPPAVLATPGPRSGRGSGAAPVVLTDVRLADHEGFDRIVLEFSGTGTPGWTVNYVEKATLEGSGEVVGLGGDSTLDIYASNTTWPASDYYTGPRRLEADDGGISEVYVAGTFEGYTQVLAGIDGSRAPFRVFALTHPSRLVVDFDHESVG